MRYTLVKETIDKCLNFCIYDNVEGKVIYRSMNKVQVEALVSDLNDADSNEVS